MITWAIANNVLIFKLTDVLLKLFAKSSSCVNPFLYCWLNDSFRAEMVSNSTTYITIYILNIMIDSKIFSQTKSIIWVITFIEINFKITCDKSRR